MVLNTNTFPKTSSFIKSCCGCKTVLKTWPKCNLGRDVCLSFHGVWNNSSGRCEPHLDRVFSHMPSILNLNFLYSSCSSRQARFSHCMQSIYCGDKACIYFRKETLPIFSPIMMKWNLREPVVLSAKTDPSPRVAGIAWQISLTIPLSAKVPSTSSLREERNKHTLDL